MKTLTPQQKSTHGLTLSAADIQALLKDPNSWVFKLYNDCLLIAAITEAQFIHLAHRIVCEQKLLAQALANNARAERNIEKETRLNQAALQQAHQPSFTMDPLALKLEMATLIALPQANMTPMQLAAQYQQMTNNLNNQVAARLGSSITVSVKANGINTAIPITLAVPSLSTRSAASAIDLIKLSPSLGVRLIDKGMRAGFAKHVADAGMGHLAVINKWKEIVSHNPDAFKQAGIDPDNMTISPSMLKSIDKAYQACLNENNGLRECLQKNNEFALDAALSGITNEAKNAPRVPVPTLFQHKPSPAQRIKTIEAEEEHLSSYSRQSTPSRSP